MVHCRWCWNLGIRSIVKLRQEVIKQVINKNTNKMSSNDTLNKIKTILGLEVSFETKKLENGTTFESEKFENGSEVFILTEDERIPVPVGKYTMEDGFTLTIQKEGVIASLAEDEEEKEDEREDEGEADVQDWAGMEKRIKNLEIAVADLKKDKENKMEDVEEEIEEEEVEASNSLKSRTVKEEFARVQPFKHSPEKEAKQKLTRYGQNRRMTTQDRVFNQIFNS